MSTACHGAAAHLLGVAAAIDRSLGLRGVSVLDAAFFEEDLAIRAVGDTLVLAPSLIATVDAEIAGTLARILARLR